MSLKENFIFFFLHVHMCIFCGAQVAHRAVSSDRPPSWAAVIHEKPPQDSRNPTFWVPHFQRCECNLLWPSWALDGTCGYLTCNPQSNNFLRKHVTWHNVFVLTSSFMSYGKFLKIFQGHSWFHLDLSKSLKVSCWSLKVSQGFTLISQSLSPRKWFSVQQGKCQEQNTETVMNSSIHSYCRQPFGETHRFLGF